ncbi:solute carrier family 2, facilitated glucose transporter member 11-like [Mobula birostris]|uniref:solute carrier family 2, facilitated glucose transporter member 11-like n=1 Tax=Mobula birostris TaxID=1983395 RepID=UPI003B286DA3
MLPPAARRVIAERRLCPLPPGGIGQECRCFPLKSVPGEEKHFLHLLVTCGNLKFIQMFINETWIERYGKPLESEVITLLWTIIITAFCVGGVVGVLIAGPMAITCGRRNSLLLSNIFVLVGNLLMGLSKTARSFEMILIGRFFTGISSGVGVNINPMYLGESAPKKIRGTVALSYAPFTAAGLVTGQVLGLSEVLGREETWPILLSASAVPALIQLATLPWCPESPKYLLIDKEDKDMCMKASLDIKTYTMPYVSVISIFASILSFGIGPAGVTGIIPMEIFDQTARPSAYMFNGFLFWINFIIIRLTFPFIVEGLGSFCYVPFLFLSFLFVVFIGIFLPKTKGKTFLEISKEFHKQNARGLK